MADSNVQSSGPLNGTTEVAMNGNGVTNGNGTAAQKKEKEPLIKSCDMTETMKDEAIAVTRDAFDKFSLEKDIAAYIKRTFDQKKGATWHCIVGRNFGSFVTHETKHFIYFYMGNCAILLFKTQ